MQTSGNGGSRLSATCRSAWARLAPAEARYGWAVADVAAERERIHDALGVAVSEIERIEGVAAWCTFEDPFGNRLGLFEDLADVSSLDYPP